MHNIAQFITRIVKKTVSGDNSNVLTIMNRMTRQVKDVKIDSSKLVKMEAPGWFWSDELLGYLIFGNRGYYPPSCGNVDEKAWIVLNGDMDVGD